MKTFPLRIGTPDGLMFEGNAVRIVCRTITGDRAILAGHTNFCTGLGMGEAHVVFEDESVRKAACIGGMITMMNGTCTVLATTWEWADELDKERAEKAKNRAEETLGMAGLTDREYNVAKAKLNRALVRLSVK